MPNNESKLHEEKGLNPLLAGGLSGMLGGYTFAWFEIRKKLKESGQPIPYLFKIRAQRIADGTYISLWHNLKGSFKGANAFALPLFMVSATQVAGNSRINSFFPAESPYAKYVAAAFAGALGGLVSTPVEHIVYTQHFLKGQNLKSGPVAAIKYLKGRGYTYAWTGLKPLLIRESIFGFTMLTGADAAGEWLNNQFNMSVQLKQRDSNNVWATYNTNINMRFIGACGIGLVGAALTHPFDVMATYKQKSPERISVLTACKQIMSEPNEKKWRNFFKGYPERAALFTGCMYVIGKSEKFLQNDPIGDLKKWVTTFFSSPPSNSTPPPNPPSPSNSPGFSLK